MTSFPTYPALDPCDPLDPQAGEYYDPGYLRDRLGQAQDEIRKLRTPVEELEQDDVKSLFWGRIHGLPLYGSDLIDALERALLQEKAKADNLEAECAALHARLSALEPHDPA